MERIKLTVAQSLRLSNILQDYWDIESDSDLEKNQISYSDYQSMGLQLADLLYTGQTRVTQKSLAEWYGRHCMKVDFDAQNGDYIVVALKY